MMLHSTLLLALYLRTYMMSPHSTHCHSTCNHTGLHSIQVLKLTTPLTFRPTCVTLLCPISGTPLCYNYYVDLLLN